MYLKWLLCAVVISCVSAAEVTKVSNKCPPETPIYYYGHAENCSYFFSCAHGQPYLQYCPTGTVWSDESLACVNFNSHLDTCTGANAVRECGSHADILIPHPTACQRYYNCSDDRPRSSLSSLGEHEDECPYPQLFDVNKKQCTPFYEAFCGPRRHEAKNPCDYLKNRCGSAHCEPCASRLPSCVGKPNGVHEHPLRLWSRYYIECASERLVVGLKVCQNFPDTNTVAVYSPIKKACVSLWEVPPENGGLAPSCNGKTAGQYQTEERPDVYYRCPAAGVSYCGIGFVFDEESGTCERAH